MAFVVHKKEKKSYGIAHSQEYHAAQLEQRAGDVHSRHHIQTAGGVALVHNGHTAGPEKFVDQQGQTLADDVTQKLAGDVHGAECAADVAVLGGVQMGPAGDDAEFSIAGDDGGQSRAFHAHCGSAEVAEDQHIVQHQVDQSGGNAGHHRHHGVAGFLQVACVGLGQGKGKEAEDHHPQILAALCQNLCGWRHRRRR